MNLETNEWLRRRLPLVLLSGCLIAWAPGAGGQPADADVRRDATVVAVEKVMPSVVNIATETIIHVRDPFEDFFRQFWGPYHRQSAAQFAVQPRFGGRH